MAYQTNVGSSASEAAAAPSLVSVYVLAGGAGTVVTNNSGDTLNVYTDPELPATSTITSGNNATFTTPGVYISSAGISTVTFSGPGF